MAENFSRQSRITRIWVTVALLSALTIWIIARQRSRPSNESAPIPSLADSVQAVEDAQTRQQAAEVSGAVRMKSGLSSSNEQSILERHRSAILNGPYGKAPIAEVIRALAEVGGGPEVQVLFQTLALRKQDALPLVKQRLRIGDVFEKHALTKFLRDCPWPETNPELLALAGAGTEHWLARQGALYALASLSDPSTGPQIVVLLHEQGCPESVRLVAVAALARIGYREASSAIAPLAEDGDMHIRLFASRALGELGQPVHKDFLLATLQETDYITRQEACEALWCAEGADVTEKLQQIARNDVNEAVRDSATQALLRRQMNSLTPEAKLALLRRGLEGEGGRDWHNSLWIVQTMMAQCGESGRAFVAELAEKDNPLAERCRAYLVFAASNTSSL